MSSSNKRELSGKDLQLKATNLLCLFTMLRPSDVAPKSVPVKDKSGRQQNNIFIFNILCGSSDFFLVMVV